VARAPASNFHHPIHQPVEGGYHRSILTHDHAGEGSLHPDRFQPFCFIEHKLRVNEHEARKAGMRPRNEHAGAELGEPMYLPRTSDDVVKGLGTTIEPHDISNVVLTYKVVNP
jgi:hypothetical protein